MLRSLTKSLWLLGFAVMLTCGVYPLILWDIGQTFFPFQASSLLVAQPFTKDEYFWPRPSAASYDGTLWRCLTIGPSASASVRL
jgi:K+-transporting ATPase ATPase C chain